MFLRANIGTRIERIHQTLDQWIGDLNVGAHRNMSSFVHHEGLRVNIAQIKSNFNGSFFYLAVGVDVEAVNSQERGGSANRTSRQSGYGQLVTEGIPIVAHRPVTIGDGSHLTFDKRRQTF